MSSVVRPIRPGKSADPEVNKLLEQARDGWWNDAAMFGVIARQPDLLKKIVPVFEAFFTAGRFPPYMFETHALEDRRDQPLRLLRDSPRRWHPRRSRPEGRSGVRQARPECAVTPRVSRRQARRIHGGRSELHPGDSFYKELKAEFSEDEIVELIFACSIFNFGNKFNISMRLDTSEESKYPKGMAYPLKAAQVAAA